MKSLKSILNDNKLNVSDENNLKISPNYGTDKGFPKSYIDKFYENKFKEYREKNINLLEIGVRSGASLKLWSEYFSNNSKIYGVDNLFDEKNNSVPINQEWVSGDSVEYIVGDAYDKQICDKFDEIDILIDDGPHTFESHVKLLELYLPKIKKDGVVVIEDISYNYNLLYQHIPDNLKNNSYVLDYGGYDNRLIVIEF